MGTYQHRTSISATADDLFAYLSDVGNLPAYMPGMVEAHRTGPEEVSVKAKVDTDQDPSTPEETVEGKAWFEVDESARRLSWGSEGPNDYHGNLTVSGSNGESEVEVTLHTNNVEGPDIDHDLERMLRVIKQQVEDRR